MNIYVEDSGPKNRTPVVLIHAFPLSSAMWEPQFTFLKKEFRVVRYDVRGFGRSTGGDGQFTMEQYADDLLWVLESLKAEKAVLCGLSMGGYIALRFAEKYPERVKALILADTKAEADGNEAKIKRAQSVKLLKTQGTAAFLEGFTKGALAEDAPEPLVQEVKRIALPNAPLDISGALLAMAARTDTSATLPKLQCPALVIVGEKDKLTPPEQAKKMADALPRATLVTLKGAGHLSNLEKPAEFTSHVIEFLKPLDP